MSDRHPQLKRWTRKAGAAAALLIAAAAAVPAHADTNANTDDKSVTAPTGWYVYTNQTTAQITTLINTNQARITDIEVYNAAASTFTVTMVANSGSYASGWWWYVGQTVADVSAKLTANNARLIDITPYATASGIRFAAVMVPNTGAQARNWNWLAGVTSAQISTFLTNSNGTANPQRLTDIRSYVEGGVKKYVALFISNTGTDKQSWEWWLNQSASGVASKVSAFTGRIVRMDRQSDGTYNFIQVKNGGRGVTSNAWWYQTGFTNGTDLLNYAFQVGSRPIDVLTYTDTGGVRRYDAVYLDNSNTSTRRVRGEYAKSFLDANGNPSRGIFEAYLKQVGSAVKVDLNSGRGAETASSLKSLHLLHSMKQVELGNTTLNSAFVYYNYPDGPVDDPSTPDNENKDSCPNPAEETAANKQTNYNFEKGLDEMMRISDNRAARGVVLRYGFDAINDTANDAGLVGTELRHNIGCAYRNPATGKYDPAHLRNETTAHDLATIYEGVWNQTLLSNTHKARAEFLESANPGVGASQPIQAIIDSEAAKQGKSSIAAAFGALVKTWGKAGSYGTCLPDSAGNCGQAVEIRSSTGIIQLPVKSTRGTTSLRTYVYGTLVSDVPISCFGCTDDDNYVNAYRAAHYETFRDEIRIALNTW